MKVITFGTDYAQRDYEELVRKLEIADLKRFGLKMLAKEFLDEIGSDKENRSPLDRFIQARSPF